MKYPDNFQVAVRKAEKKDLDGIMAIEEECFSSPWPRSAMLDELCSNPFSRLMVAEVDGAIVGFIVFWLVADEVHLQNIASTGTHRRRGVARALIDRLLVAAEKRRSSLITLEVRTSNEAARRLYEEYGFVPVGLRKGYYADSGEDAIVMLLDLSGALWDG